MRKVVIACTFLLAGSTLGQVHSTRADFEDAARQQYGAETTKLVPDSSLGEFAQEAIIWTSVDAGGVEAQYKIITVTGQGFYAIADSIVAILETSYLQEDGQTRSLPHRPPQLHEELGGATAVEGGGEDDVPGAWSYWADTLQLMPVPQSDADTIVLKCWVEHRALPDDSMTIQMQSAFVDVAKWNLCMRMALSLDPELPAVGVYKALYDEARKSLLKRFARRYDIVKTDD